ncbi:MAG: 23S rRNA (guanosine(2251)-2'-O)-methyltransferase RlmB [Alphaproteobacteria bacterium]
MARRKSISDRGRSASQNPTGAVWLHGRHAVAAALSNPVRQCHRLLLTAEAGQSLGEGWRRKRPEGESPAIEVVFVAREAIDAVVPDGAVHQGAALLVDPLDPLEVSDLRVMASSRDRATVVVLDQVTDPHNVGAVLRSAAAFGAIGLVVQDRHAPEETGTLAKAASGALELVPLVRAVNLARALEELKDGGFWCLGLDAAATTNLSAADLSGRIALVLGSEGQGLRRLVRESCDLLVRLPICDGVESLNVSNAAAVALYELARPRSPC